MKKLPLFSIVCFVVVNFFTTQLSLALSGNVDAHDPSTIIKDGNKYWRYSTGQGIYAVWSTDLFKWTAGSKTVFPLGTHPSWINSAVPGFDGTFWAPDVIFINGKYHLYYSCSTFGSFTSAIGVATSPTLDQDSPDYLWTDQGMVVSSSSSNSINAIDPSVFKDTDGKLYLTYGSYFNGIGTIELDTLTAKVKPGASLHVIAGGSGAAWEASYMIREGNYYYLFANRASCCRSANSTYYIVTGRSSSPFGPFVDKAGLNLLGSAGGGTPVLISSGRYIGPGHFALLKENGRNIVSTHYYDGMDNGNSKLDISALSFTTDGWPVISRNLIQPGRYKITNKSSNLVWDAAGCTGALGQHLVQSIPDNSACQQWDFIPVGDGYFKISNETGAQTVDVPSCNSANGTLMQTYNWLDNNCQKFKVEQLTNGSYVITTLSNATVTKVIEVPAASNTAGAQLGLFDFNGCTCQQWSIDNLNVPTALMAQNITADSFKATWNANPGVSGYQFDVSTSTAFSGSEARLVGWNFAGGTNTANSGVAANQGKMITAGGGIFAQYNAAGNSQLTAGATGWNSGSGTKFWEVNFTSEGYGNLSISSIQRSGNDGPIHFKLQYKTDPSAAYTDIAGAFVATGDNYLAGKLVNVTLPPECDNQPTVYLRWLMITNTSVDNNTVAGPAQSNIDDIIINASPENFVTGFNDLLLSDTVKSVTGLTANADYYYRVRSLQGNFVSAWSNVIMVTTTTVLPLSFLNIKAFEKNGDIQVEWNTATEINIEHYDVEKSSNGWQFNKAGWVAAGILLNGAASYNWLDKTVSGGNNFYRIKAIGRNGEVTFSKIVKINGGSGNSAMITYPNPVTDRNLTLELVNRQKGLYTIVLFNNAGQQVYKTQVNHAGGSSTQILRIANRLPGGIYTITITNRQTRQLQKIVLN